MRQNGGAYIVWEQSLTRPLVFFWFSWHKKGYRYLIYMLEKYLQNIVKVGLEVTICSKVPKTRTSLQRLGLSLPPTSPVLAMNRTAVSLRCTSYPQCRATHPIPVQCWASVAAYCWFKVVQSSNPTPTLAQRLIVLHQRLQQPLDILDTYLEAQHCSNCMHIMMS